MAKEEAAKEQSKEGEETQQQLEESKDEGQPLEERKKDLESQKVNLEAQLLEEENEVLEVKYPPKVKEHDKLNLILIGPEKSGKTTVANYLAQEHQRCVVRMD